jgi:DNA-directed RNA polymerase specialized sigma24 family protein
MTSTEESDLIGRFKKGDPSSFEAIVLREIEQLSYEEIGEVPHISVGSVKSQISRAREELRHLLMEI